MKFHRLPGRLWVLQRGCQALVPVLVFTLLTWAGFAKTIRLRNETITTPFHTHAAPAQKLATVVPGRHGLLLIQFESALEPAARAQLRAQGVELLKYVPDDAYIARLRNGTPEQVASLPCVHWIGQYRSDHKIHPRLRAGLGQALAANQPVAVNILAAPGANPAELGEVRSLLAAVTHESSLRQGTILQGSVQPRLLQALAISEAVLWIEPAPQRKLVDELASKIVGGDDGLTGTPTVTQQRGFAGAGVTVSVADTGLDTGNAATMHPDLRGRVTGFHAYGSLGNAADEYGHGTHVAGIVAGNAATGETDPDSGAFFGLGVASQASLYVQRIFDSDGFQVTPFPTDEELTHDAVRSGAQIGSNSWGSDVQGDYDTDASQFDELVRDADASTAGDQPYILVFSAGNAGPGSQTMDTPASAKNVLAVGASESVPNTLAMTYGLYADGPDTIADFSSRGPCMDGRLKPDVVAPGTWISSLASSEAFDLAAVSWMTNDQYYVYMGGTSMAGPHASGAAAIFVQYYKSLHTNAVPSPALVKAALINSATELDQANGGPGPIPNNDEGWGRVNLADMVVTNQNAAARYYEYLDQTILLTNTQVYTRHALVQGSGQPLKITLAYTDVAGFPGAIPALVNDLDLEVVGPDGTLYRGNQLAAGYSVPNPPNSDNLNNVEGVHLAQPIPGDYTIRMRARKIVEDARLDTSIVDQDFALVVSGDLSRATMGTVLLDRPSYTAPSTIRLQVLDPSKAGSGTVNVLLKSTTEALGETSALHASGNYGVFTGAVATVVGAAAVDGKLEIHNGDTIEADYVDGSGSTRSATASADLVAPSITGVSSSVDLGIVTINWQTSEPADSVVYFGTNLPPTLTAANSVLTTTHSVRLRNLVAGRTYYFSVSSTDAAGNAAGSDNSGAYYTFVALPAPTVLLVDAYEQAEGSNLIDDGTYTNALAAAGYSFAVWKVLDRGSPQLQDLEPFPVVIWRPTDDIVNYDGTNGTLSASQQFMIEQYLNEGGSFFVSSMSLASQLGDVPFRRNVLQVAGYVQNPGFPFPCGSCDEFVGVPSVVGSAASPITAGMSMTLNYQNYPWFDLFGEDVYGPDFGSTFTPGTNATLILFDWASGKTCGMSYPRVGVDSPGRVVFLSVPIDTFPASGAPPNTEATLLRNALKFLVPGANGIGTLSLDSSIYTIPDRVTVEVGDSDLAGTGQTTVTFSTSSATNRVNVTLAETSHPGLFRGYITLVATNPAPDQLPVRNGATITAQYFDASNQSNVVASATLDTLPPAISQVTAVTGFSEALLSWTTSKPADSLVQYGGSALLDRSAYQQQFVTNHAVFISGLAANRTYFFQVASRDQAGNTTVDDNNGNLYTFVTRRAPQPPWSDNLEIPSAGWTVVPDPANGSDMNWSLGPPTGNLLQSTAHSGTNCWGSDLQGQDFNFLASSYLGSPLIDLSGLSSATLTFWHCYDFNPNSFEQGQILVSTNAISTNSSAAFFTALPVLVDFSGLSELNWYEETLDLTPFVGQTIQIVWQYAGVSLGLGSPVNGWLVDDVSITGVTAGASGTIIVTKNLSQGNFTLTGPANRTGSDFVTTITNAPPGLYSIRFSDVAFYNTPQPQTNFLTSARTLTLAGNYSFTDANSNGISDAWEQYYFGSAWTNRIQQTDSDADGMTDYAEFIAGTNPTNAASKLIFLSATAQTNQTVQLRWAAIPGRVYQLESSPEPVSWTPVSAWMRATASPMTFTATNAAQFRLFRVEVRP